MSDTEVLHAPSDEVDDVRVSDHYPLGCSGGAGGEKDMCRTLGGVLAGQRRRRRVLQVTVSEGEIESVRHRPPGSHPPYRSGAQRFRLLDQLIEKLRRRLVREEKAGLASIQDGGDARRGLGTIHGDVDATHLQDSENAYDGKGRFLLE